MLQTRQHRILRTDSSLEEFVYETVTFLKAGQLKSLSTGANCPMSGMVCVHGKAFKEWDDNRKLVFKRHPELKI